MLESRLKIGLYVESPDHSDISYDSIPSEALLTQIMEQHDPNKLDYEEFRDYAIQYYQTLLANSEEVRIISETLRMYALAK